MMGLLMQFIQPLFRKAKWHISSILAGIAIFSYLFTEYLLLNFIRGDFTFPPRVLYRIYLTSALTMLFFTSHLLDYPPTCLQLPS